MEMNDVVSERGEEGMGGLGRGWAGRGGVVLVTRRVCLPSLEFTPSDQMGGAMGGGRTGGSMPGKDKVGALSKDDSRGEIGTNTTITTVAAAFSAANSTTCARHQYRHQYHLISRSPAPPLPQFAFASDVPGVIKKTRKKKREGGWGKP